MDLELLKRKTCSEIPYDIPLGSRNYYINISKCKSRDSYIRNHIEIFPFSIYDTK